MGFWFWSQVVAIISVIMGLTILFVSTYALFFYNNLVVGRFVFIVPKRHYVGPIIMSICSILIIWIMLPIALSVIPTNTLMIHSDNPEKLFTFIQMTNPHLLVGVRSIDTNPHFYSNAMPVLVMLLKNANGEYHPVERSIVINPDTLTAEVWFHELAHHVWFMLLTDEERTEFTTIHKKNIRILTTVFVYNANESVGGLFPTLYSVTNDQEDFADSFMIYTLHRDEFSKYDNVRSAFLERVLSRIEKQTFK